MSIGLTAVWHRVLGNEADDLSKLETEGVMFLQLRGPSLRVLFWKIGLLCTFFAEVPPTSPGSAR